MEWGTDHVDRLDGFFSGGLAAITVVVGTAIPATAAFATDDYPVPPSPTVEVEGTTVTRPATQAKNNNVEVLGAQVTRGSMPFTGGDVAGLAAIGVGAVAVGAVLVQRSASRQGLTPARSAGPAGIGLSVRRSPRCAPCTVVVELREHVEGAEVLVHLLDPAGAGDHGRHVRVRRAPGDGQLGQRARRARRRSPASAATLALRVGVGEHVLAATRSPGARPGCRRARRRGTCR